MGCRSLRRALFGAAVYGLFSLPAAHGQFFHKAAPAPCPPKECAPAPLPNCPAAPAPSPTPTDAPRPPDQTTPPMPPPNQATPPAQPTDLGFGGESGAPGGGESGGFAAPNMIGSFLGAGKSVSYFFSRLGGPVIGGQIGSTNVLNSSIADNNSPIPQDRFSFRYNHFADAQSVIGPGSLIPAPELGVGRQKYSFVSTTYDLDQYTFSGEKTFFDGRSSVELRIPFSRGLASKLNISGGNVTGIGNFVDAANIPVFFDPNFGFLQTTPDDPNRLRAFNVTPTPQNTAGSTDTEFGNMSVIFKSLVCRSSNLAISAGLGVGLPTADDTHVRVTDYLGSIAFNNVDVQRIRDFHVKNETVGLTPFFAALFTPTDRLFVQGFYSVEVPLNKSEIIYSETARNLNASVLPFTRDVTDPAETGNILNPPFKVKDHIREQTLMHMDLGTGIWVIRNPERRFLTGLAPTLELHYTTCLNNADVVQLPKDPGVKVVPTGQFATSPIGPIPIINTVPPPNPTVGNLRGHVDILDLTIGTTFLFGERLTVAPAVTLPMRGRDNSTFDWEFQLQLNYYFGGPRRPYAPSF